MKTALVIIGSAVGVALLAIGGWFLYWHAFASATSRTAKIYQTQYGAQSAYIEQADNLIPQIDSLKVTLASPNTPRSETSALKAEIATMTNQTCGIIGTITTKPTNIASWASSNCGGN